MSADGLDQFRVGLLAISVIFLHLWYFQWKFLELTPSINTTKRNIWIFFSEFFSHTPFQKWWKKLKNRDFDTTEFVRKGTWRVSVYRMSRTMTQMVGLTESNTWNYFQNSLSILFSRNGVWSETNVSFLELSKSRI